MKRLVEGSLPPRAATLLRSASADVPPRAAEEKARLASLVANEVSSPPASGRFPSGKWIGVLPLAMIVVAGAVGTGYYVSTSTPASRTSAPTEEIEEIAAASPPASPPQIAATSAPASPAPPKSVAVTDLPSVPVGRAQPAKPLAAPNADRLAEPTAPAGSDTASLGDELAAIDAARAAFVEHHPSLAIERVESYRHRFPSGHFMDEAEALEIQSLVALGQMEAARVRAERFLAARPESPYAQRVRSAVGFKK